jgi:hypothetical protein
MTDDQDVRMQALKLAIEQCKTSDGDKVLALAAKFANFVLTTTPVTEVKK